MSHEALERIIGRAILDTAFRIALFADPDGTLASYELTDAERAALRFADAESLEACGKGMGQRMLSALRSTETWCNSA